MQSSNETPIFLVEPKNGNHNAIAESTSEKEYQELFENVPVGIYCTTTDGQILKANATLLKILGYASFDELLEHNFLADWQARYARKYFSKVLERYGKINGIESVWSRRDGSLIVVRESARAIRGKDGAIKYYQGSIEDISDCKQTESELRKSQQAYIDLINDIDGIVWSAETDPFKYTFVSNQAEKILGYPVRQWLSEISFWKKHIHPDDRDWVVKVCEEAIADSRDHWFEYRMIAANGQVKWIRDNVTVVINEDNSMKLQGIMIDITETKDDETKKDETNLHHQQDLMDIMVGLNTRLLRIQRLENISILANVIGHDLNNVLSPVVMTLPLLKRRHNDEWSQKILTTLESTVKRGVDLVTQVLNFARSVECKAVTLAITPTILEVKKIIKETFPGDIQFMCEISENLWEIKADAMQLRQVLMNLCLNSRDAMFNGGVLKIRAENIFVDESYSLINNNARVGQYLLVAVSDTGIGIPPEILEKIFDPFFTTKTTKENNKNIGLGLSAVFNVVKSCGGFITVTSKTFVGTEIKLFFPALGTKAITDYPKGF